MPPRRKFEGTRSRPKVLAYTLSTCGHCRRAKELLRSLGVAFDYVDVDLTSGKEREAVMAEVMRLNPGCSFPTIVVGRTVIVGNDEERIRRALS